MTRRGSGSLPERDSRNESVSSPNTASSATSTTGAPRVTREASLAKLYATEAAQRAADRAVQISGGLGVTRGQKAEELYREVRALRVYEGASEIQRVVIARAERDRFLAEQQGGT